MADGAPAPGRGKSKRAGTRRKAAAAKSASASAKAAGNGADQAREAAREWARRYAAESRKRIDAAAAERVRELERLSSEIGRHAQALAERSAELAELLEKELDVPPAPSRGSRRGAGAPKRRFAHGAEGVSEDVRLTATQMAVAGSSREEISERLRSEHGVKDSGAVLERIGI